jgi:hypothetical protein
MTTITTLQSDLVRLIGTLRALPWAKIADRTANGIRLSWAVAQLIVAGCVLLGEVAWEHRAKIRQGLVTAIAAVYVAGCWTREQAERCYRAGCWTRHQLERFSGRTVALLPQQPVEALAPITATMQAAREALARLIARLYPAVA